ncbi:hypothetical protein EV702DRAFT_1198981 [Suillus placidus]|uniref:Uncharacterized protein n=1 Tax=Suillus placidus TaxID=48579 RepID=A0A9P6ZT43_9AGAM|nr:hypothetical protein EV702DRAFT_1198981 [Suillus placidus]
MLYARYSALCSKNEKKKGKLGRSRSVHQLEWALLDACAGLYNEVMEFATAPETLSNPLAPLQTLPNPLRPNLLPRGPLLQHCKADDDTIIGHLKVQVYNLTSLGIVEEAFPGDNSVVQPDVHNERNTSIALSDTIDISKDGTRWIKAEISRQLASLGGKFLSSKKFPWNTLPGELTRQGMMIKGYPEDVILPGEYHASKSKGIANLTLKEAGEVIAALKAGTMCLKKVSEDKQAQILISECPVVEGARPPADSVHPAGRRLFANGLSDRKGLAREKPSKAVTQRKGKTSQKAPAFRTSPISLSDDSNSDDASDPPIGRPPPRRPFKFAQLPKQQKEVVKQKEVISLVSSDAQSGSEDGATKKADSDYEDKAMSKKRKAKSEGGS